MHVLELRQPRGRTCTAVLIFVTRMMGTASDAAAAGDTLTTLCRWRTFTGVCWGSAQANTGMFHFMQPHWLTHTQTSTHTTRLNIFRHAQRVHVTHSHAAICLTRVRKVSGAHAKVLAKPDVCKRFERLALNRQQHNMVGCRVGTRGSGHAVETVLRNGHRTNVACGEHKTRASN